MYSRSTASRSSKVSSPRPKTCIGPVRPGFTAGGTGARAVALDELDLLRPRADEAHVAAEHVPELRQLVEARAPQEAADARHPRVVASLNIGSLEARRTDELGEPLLGVGHHRPELEHPERPPSLAGPRVCAEEHRAAPIEPIATRGGRSGARTTSASARSTSIARLRSSVERETSQVLYSTTGRSATWFSRTAVPNMPRAGGTTLSFTCARAQSATSSAIRRSSIALRPG